MIIIIAQILVKKYFRIDFPYFSNYRKPNPGMLYELKKTYNLDLKKSYFIGDRDIDILAGKKQDVKLSWLKVLNLKIINLK